MRIAVSCEMDFLGKPQMTRSICNMDYIDFVKEAGYNPFIVCAGMDVDTIASEMDGLLLTGGKDISPLLYNQDLDWHGATKCNLIRDTFERDLYKAFVKLGKPVFGICRGFQMICILATDELKMHQDINKLKSVHIMHQQGEVEVTGENPVHSIECRGVLEILVGTKLLVNSFHHQGFPLDGKTIEAGWIRQCEDVFCWGRSNDSAKILEAFGMFVKDENDNDVKVAGVQYHPERMMRRQKDRTKHLALFRYTMGTLACDWTPSPPPLPAFTPAPNPAVAAHGRHTNTRGVRSK